MVVSPSTSSIISHYGILIGFGSAQLPVVFFGHIATEYEKDAHSEDPAPNFFTNEIEKFHTRDDLLKSIASQIVILSANVRKKYRLVNLSFILVIVSLGMMSLIVFAKYII